MLAGDSYDEAVLAARESVDMPRPGDTRAGRFGVSLRDPAEPWLFAPVGWLRERIVTVADAMQFLTIRQTLSVMFAVLVLFTPAFWRR